uniref:Uncharacterized protein n=1 Tax=Oryza punctata TaxID=4537 RepID=A0A0E0JTI7_ORYPU
MIVNEPRRFGRGSTIIGMKASDGLQLSGQRLTIRNPFAKVAFRGASAKFRLAWTTALAPRPLPAEKCKTNKLFLPVDGIFFLFPKSISYFALCKMHRISLCTCFYMDSTAM